MDQSPIGKLERKNHLNHLTKVVPFIVLLFAIQCFLIYHFMGGVEIFNTVSIIGIGIISLICSLLYYDYNHHIILYQDHLHIYFSLALTNREIGYDEIENISVGEEGTSFSSVYLNLIDGEKVTLHFIDYPDHVKDFILHLKKGKSQESFSIAA